MTKENMIKEQNERTENNMLRLNTFKKVFNIAKTTEGYNEGCKIIKEYYELCDSLQVKYGKVGKNYLAYDSSSKLDRVKPDDTQVHHIEQVWYTESINPKYSSSNDYKTSMTKVEISRHRKVYKDYVLSKYGHLQGQHLLCFCNKEEHKKLHELINQFQIVTGLKGSGVSV